MNSSVPIPAIDCLAVGARDAALLSDEGEIQTCTHDRAGMLIHKKPVLCAYAPYIRQRLGTHEFYPLDVMELFAFVHPATFCVPTIHGLCNILSLPAPQSLEDAAFSLLEITRTLLEHLRHDQWEAKAPAADIARAMGLSGKGWGWTPYICDALGEAYDPQEPVDVRPLLDACKALPEWEDSPPKPPHAHHSVTGAEAEQRLSDLLHNSSATIEMRPQQKSFTQHIAQCFDTPSDESQPHIILAEAGTGTGKTLGYLAPASLWAEKNDAAVWVSTYTKNLQQQIYGELSRLYPRQADKDEHVAIRKGRENYLCLLNLHENASGLAASYHPQSAIATGLMVRWVVASGDGDLSGSAFPGWLNGLLGFAGTAGLADRRGECIYSACDHYKRCFSEHSVRKAKNARIVIANHALMMIQSAMAGTMERLPDRYIFDEGHHLFSAADSAFCLHLTARETRDLRRWILGPEGGRRGGRARGLKRRIEDLCEGNETAHNLLQDILAATTQITAESWTRRMKNEAPQGPCEEFLYAVMKAVYARADGVNGPYSLETPLHPVDDDLMIKAQALSAALKQLQTPMKKLAAHFIETLQNDIGDDGQPMMDSDTRKRFEATANSLEYRSSMLLQGWINMLAALEDPSKLAAQQVEWMEITRAEGQAIDVGLFSHAIDPMQAFASTIKPHLHGMAVTSATLRDIETDDENANWDNALRLSGAPYLSDNPQCFSAPSPFDYAAQSRVIIINDVNKNDAGQVAAAMQALFMASGGGGLGLFTSINRLRTVHGRIHASMEDHGLPLHAQHVDDIDTGTLIDMFKFDPRSCMLGTDATRDGVDIPGDSLKMLAFDRVPWPRPTILHKARRDHFGGRAYDEMLTRLKLKQAFGRLIRRASDKGVFVMLDSGLPSRLHDAFPPDTQILKCGLAQACETIKTFL